MKKCFLLFTVVVIFCGCNNTHNDSNLSLPPIPQNGHPVAGPPESAHNPQKGNRQELMEQIRMQKIAYMTEQLGLTVEESQLFWPVYNKYWEKAMQLQHDEHSAYKRISKSESATISDIDTIVCLYEKHADLVSIWSKEFAKVIPENKVAKVFAAEERFKNYLIKKGNLGIRDSSK